MCLDSKVDAVHMDCVRAHVRHQLGLGERPRPEDTAAVEHVLAHRCRRAGHQLLAEGVKRVKDRLGDRVGLKLLEGGADAHLRVLELAVDDADGLGVERVISAAEGCDLRDERSTGAGLGVDGAPVRELLHPALSVLPDVATGAGAAGPLARAGRGAGRRVSRSIASRRRREAERVAFAVIGNGTRDSAGGHGEGVSKASLKSARLSNQRIARIHEERLRRRGGQVEGVIVHNVATVLGIPEGLVLAVHVAEAEDGCHRDVLVLGSGGEGRHAVHNLLVHVVVWEPLLLLGRRLKLQRHDHAEDDIDQAADGHATRNGLLGDQGSVCLLEEDVQAFEDLLIVTAQKSDPHNVSVWLQGDSMQQQQQAAGLQTAQCWCKSYSPGIALFDIAASLCKSSPDRGNSWASSTSAGGSVDGEGVVGISWSGSDPADALCSIKCSVQESHSVSQSVDHDRSVSCQGHMMPAKCSRITSTRKQSTSTSTRRNSSSSSTHAET